MSPVLIALLALQLLQSFTWAKLDSNSNYDLNSVHEHYTDNSLVPSNDFSSETYDLSNDNDKSDLPISSDVTASSFNDDNFPRIQSIEDDKTELQFREPIEWVNVNSLRNSIILKFQSPHVNYLNNLDPEELKRLKVLHQNSIRLGKRDYSSGHASYPMGSDRNEAFLDKNMGMGVEYNHQVVRDTTGDNFMRFGRSINGAAISAATKDFMRFGRSGGNGDFMRFGRRPAQDFMRFGRSPGQDFMRFGRSPGQDFMRFGRSPGQDFMRFGRTGQDFMRFGRSQGQNFMRFGRSPGEDFMRIDRSPVQDFMRFGRSPSRDFMRFGRASTDQNFMRFGRASPAQDFMRFGRASPAQDFMRFGRDSNKNSASNNFARYSRPDNFMRFGRIPSQSPNFMRFGKSPVKFENHTDTTGSPMDKSDLKEAVKLIREADKNANQVVKVLFDKHEEKEHEQDQLLNEADSTLHEDDSDDLSMDAEYFVKN